MTSSQSETTEIPFARRIARFALHVAPDVCTEPVRAATVRLLVDTIACLVAAHEGEAVACARDAALRFNATGGAAGASIVGAREKVTVDAASFVNSVAARYLDYCDVYASTETLSPSDNIPVALALTEMIEIDGRRLVDAIVCGYEVHCRLADAVSTRAGGWDNVVLGALAASVMAGKLLDLDEARMAHAVAIAAIGNVALMETRAGSISMWKAATSANAARGGLTAAIAAAEGMTGPERALEGRYGLFAKVTGWPEGDVFGPSAGPARIPQISLKAYPCQYFTQATVDAALSLRERVLGAEIAEIAVETFEFGMVAAADSPAKWRPTNRETADHSLPYVVAVALLDGEVTPSQFTDERILSGDVRELMKAVSVRVDPELTSMFPQRLPCRMSIRLADGRFETTTVEVARGHWTRPLSPSEILRKFETVLPHDRSTSELVSRLWAIDNLSGKDTAALIRALMTSPVRTG